MTKKEQTSIEFIKRERHCQIKLAFVGRKAQSRPNLNLITVLKETENEFYSIVYEFYFINHT